MMRIFVSGASGYIGNAVARAFQSAGHNTWGLIRNKEHAKKLEAQEIQPVLGTLDSLGDYQELLNACEVYVHCVDSRANVGSEAKFLDKVIGLYASSEYPKAIIYTSGVWIYGSRPEIVDEASLINPLPVNKWRPSHEQKVLSGASANLRTVVMRPGCVYGGPGSLTALFCETAKSGSVELIGNGDNFWAMIHETDLGKAYLLAAEKELSKVILNVTDGSYITTKQIAEAISHAAALDGKIHSITQEAAKAKYGDLIQGLIIDQKVCSSRAQRLLDWQPRHTNFLSQADRYYRSWLASQ